MRPNIPRSSTKKYFTFALLLSLSFCSTIWADWVRILDDPIEAGAARIDIIQQAQETIDVEYYAIQEGKSADLFFGLLFEAADRGVHVRLLLDGLSNGLLPNRPDIVEAIVRHPNMELRLFNTFRFLRPSTWNQRLHDKLILVDRKQLISGGRNIGDRYYSVPEDTKPKTMDRDLYIRGDPNSDNITVEVARYFETFWQSDKVEISDIEKKLNKKRRRKNDAFASAAAAYRESLRQGMENQYKEYPKSYFTRRNWADDAIEPTSTRVIYDPIGGKSESSGTAVALYAAFALAEESILLQSPYIIPTRKMMKSFRAANKRGVKMAVLTNSPGSSPNLFAMSGYRHYRKHMADAGVQFWEFQGTDNIHAKSFIIDQHLSMIGSLNLDPRSLRTNTELMFIIDSKPFAEEFRRITSTYEKSAVLVTRKGKPVDPESEVIKGSLLRRGSQRVLSWFAPLYRGAL